MISRCRLCGDSAMSRKLYSLQPRILLCARTPNNFTFRHYIVRPTFLQLRQGDAALALILAAAILIRSFADFV